MEVYGAHGQLIQSKAVNRTATFAFFLGDRYFGVITAYVPAPFAQNYNFTSALPVQILKNLAPQLTPIRRTKAAGNTESVAGEDACADGSSVQRRSGIAMHHASVHIHVEMVLPCRMRAHRVTCRARTTNLAGALHRRRDAGDAEQHRFLPRRAVIALLFQHVEQRHLQLRKRLERRIAKLHRAPHDGRVL